ncbi:hypothetical protein JCM8547_000048 [Rhodosporidiobolus lusitaniae]
MLQRYTCTACRCASTSFAPPCRHSSCLPSSSAAAPSTSAQPVRPLDYTAPLYPSSAQPRRWFAAPRPGWATWSQPSSSPLPPSPEPAPPPSGPPPSDSTPLPTALTDADLSRLSSYLTTRGPRTALSAFRDEYGALLAVADAGDMPLLRAMVKEDLEFNEQGHRQKKKAGAERFAKGEKTSEEKTLGERVELGEEGGVVKGSVKMDAGKKEKLRKAREKAREKEVGQGGKAVKAVSVELDHEQAVKHMQHVAALPRSSTVPPALLAATGVQGGVEKRLTVLWTAFERDADLRDSPTDLHLALSFLHYLVAPSTSASTAFPPHLALSITILRSLLAFLPDSVLASDPPSSPSSPSLSQTVRVQLVLLRTLSNVALAEHDALFLPLSVSALHSLDTLRARYPALVPDVAGDDLARLDLTAEALLSSLREERTFAYRPSTLPSASPSSTPSSTLQLTYSLLRLRSSWLPSSASSPSLDPEADSTLDSFAVEAAARSRWDLLASVWETWSAKSWVMGGKEHLKLARWLAGDAPFSTYGVLEGRDPSRTAEKEDGTRRARSPRVVQKALFGKFVEASHLSMRKGLKGVGTDWTLSEKNEWLDLLVSSPAASPTSRSVARRIVAVWQAQSTGSGGKPFLLSPPTLLALVRSSLPVPHSSSASARQGALPFASRLLASHVLALVSPSSPFTSPTSPSDPPSSIHHFDLTTLAQAYALLGDWPSVAQVYRRVLESKIVPDRKDVEVILGTAPKRYERGAVELVGAAGRAGIKVDEEVWGTVLRGLMENEVAKKGVEVEQDEGAESEGRKPIGLAPLEVRIREKLDKVVDFAASMNASESTLESLRRYAEDFLALHGVAALPRHSPVSSSHALSSSDRSLSSSRVPSLLSNTLPRLPPFPLPISTSPPSSAPPISLPAARSLLRRARSSLSFPLALRTFLLAAPYYPDDPRLLSPVLRTVLDGWPRMKSGERETAKEGLREVVDMALPGGEEGGTTGGGMMRTKEVLDLVLRVLVKLEDVDAVDALFERLREARIEVEPSEEVKEVVVRWAVAELGGVKVRKGKGWIAGAKEELAAKGKKERTRKKAEVVEQ